MLLANNHFTVVVGIDIHFTTLPPFNPFHPYIGLVLDPMDYIPYIGGTVHVNGIKRGVSDTSGIIVTLVHIPLFTPPWVMTPIIGHESTNFFASQNVFADGSRFSPKGYMTMTCNDIGIPLSLQPGKKKFWKVVPTLFAPTSFMLPIPTGPTVNVGGPYVPDWGGMAKNMIMGLGFGAVLKYGAKGFKKLNKKASKLMSGADDVIPEPKIKPKVDAPKPKVDAPIPKVDSPKKITTYSDLGKKGMEPCFLVGTLVETINGLKPIEKIANGEMIITYDFLLNDFVTKRVINTFKNWCNDYYSVRVDNEETLLVTGNHMFWVESEQCWKTTKKLVVGDLLKGRNSIVRIKEVIKIENGYNDTYNLEIDELHYYLVGNNGILVHNQSKPSKFDITTTKPTSFYKITGPNKEIYIGQTTRDVNTRFDEHGIEKGWTPENGWSVEQLGKKQDLTPYEAAVWEQHYIEQNGGKNKLLNKRNEITNKKYDAYAHKHKPCK